MSRRNRRETAAPANQVPRARSIIYGIAAVIALAGVIETTYLTVLHLSGANIVCFGSGQCSEVLRSKWASIGPVPLASIGGLAYFIAFSCATLAAFRYRHAATVLGAIVALMFVASCALLYIQAFVLHAFCTYCLLSAAMTFLLAGLVIAIPQDA